MKTIITSSGDHITALFDKRFGRAAWFCLYDEASGESSFVKNESANAVSGAGTHAAEQIIKLGVGKVISGDFGQKAKDLFDESDIQMVVIQDDTYTIEAILQKLKQ